MSPGHALFLNDVLIRVKDLINGTTISAVTDYDAKTIEYYAILLDTHQVVFAEGALQKPSTRLRAARQVL